MNILFKYSIPIPGSCFSGLSFRRSRTGISYLRKTGIPPAGWFSKKRLISYLRTRTGPYLLRRKALMLFLLIQLVFLHKNYAQQWELKKDKNGIKIYIRQLENLEVKEYKAVTLVKTTADRALKLITDGDNLWKWNYKTSESKIIKTISENEFVFWIKNDLPWPIKNRDLVARVKASYQQDGIITIAISPEDTYTIPEDENAVRIKKFSGRWLVVPQGEYVEITQQLYGDPGGNLPSWIVNAMLTTAPYRTFLNLKTILEN